MTIQVLAVDQNKGIQCQWVDDEGDSRSIYLLPTTYVPDFIPQEMKDLIGLEWTAEVIAETRAKIAAQMQEAMGGN